jgi:TP901 family phage tail tape measure protein
VNSFVNIQVKIMAAQAQAQLQAMQAKLNALSGSFGKAGSSGSSFSKIMGGMGLDAFGSKVQWAGRQLEYNFTLPLVAAGTAAGKMALDNEAAFTRITKVYGDATHGAQFYSKEISALQGTFEQLSNTYGVNQAETLNVAADWAAAGASGIALAKSVDLTMQTMILGEMSASDATKALISIQAQYGFGVADLTKTIAVLNMVENQTGISLEGLVQGFEKSAGVARSTGVDVRHLAAMLAALTPATGSAAAAGNALKTIFSRLISPTKETTQVLGLMGIKISDTSWKSATMTDRLIVMAKKFQGLSDSQKGVVSSVAASRWQVNKFEVLMRDLINTNGYYQKSLQATAHDTDVFNQMNKELTAVLQSNPRRLQIIWTMLQNAAADVITPMIPLVLWLAQGIQKMVTAFTGLPQPVQVATLGLLTFLAVIGPIVRIFGASIVMVSQLGKLFMLLAAPIKLAGTALSFLLKTPVTWLLTSIGNMVRGVILSLGWLVTGAKAAMSGLQTVMLVGAKYAGLAFYSGLGMLQSVAVGIWYGLEFIFTSGLKGIQAAVLIGVRGIGIAWRAGLAAIAALQGAWSALMSISWSGAFSSIGKIVTVGLSGIGALFMRFIPVMRAASLATLDALTGPWGIAITAVIVLVVAFWGDLKKIWSAVVRGTINAFNALPQGIQGAMMAVVNIVKSAVMAVYKLFSYLNPWAHHSPSLVENVTTGMDEVERQFKRAAGFGAVFKSAYNDMQRFGKALALLQQQADMSDYADMRKNIKAVDPGALASYDRLIKILPTLKADLASIKPALDAQAAAVAALKDKLDAANDALDAQQKILDSLSKVADGYKDQMEAAQTALDGFTNAPIKGMKAMSDAIFDNQMQQKALQLQMMKMEDAVGPLDKLQSRIEAINGQIELLKGTQTDLRNAGAGSEILGQYDDQIKALEDQQDAINAQIAPIQDLSDQIADLGHQADELDLEQSLAFDPLTKQIQDATQAMQELPFDEIMKGITENKAKVDDLTKSYNDAQAAVDKQQKVVDQYTAQRDAVQSLYDVQSKGLDKLQKQYDAYSQQISDIEQALKDMGSAADTINKAKNGGAGGSLTPGAENFKAAAGGNFPDPGGFAQIGREGGLEDQSKMIDDFTKEMAAKTAKMFGIFNFLDPIKKGWNTAWGWVKSNIGPAFSAFGSSVSGAFGTLDLFKGAGTWISTLKDIGGWIESTGKMIWKYLGPEVMSLIKSIRDAFVKGFQQIQPELAKFRDLVGPVGQMLKNLFDFLKPILTVVLALILAVLKGLIRAIANGIGPIIGIITSLIEGIIKVIRGIIEFITGIFTGNWKLAWQGIVDIFGGIWTAISGILSNAVKAVLGIIGGFISGFIGFFTQLYDELVGHSIVPDMVTEIIVWIATLPQKAWDALVSLGAKIIDRIVTAFTGALDAGKKGWATFVSWVSTLAQDMWNKLSSFVTKTASRATEAFTNFLSNSKAGWGIIGDWLGGLAQSAYNKVSGMAGKLGSRASEAMSGFKNSFVNGWNSVGDWLAGMGDRIKGKVGSLTNLLTNIGRSIMSSLLNGLKDAWNDVASWLGGVGQKIKDLKGPIEKDRVLLVPEGGAIMDGLGTGLQKNWGGVEGWLSGVATQIANTLAASNQLDNALNKQYTTQATIAGQNRQTAYNNNGQAGGGNSYTFTGDLSFPNIQNGTDAEEFLLNLEALVKG